MHRLYTLSICSYISLHERYQGNWSIFPNHSFPSCPPFQRTSSSTTGSSPTLTNNPSSIPDCHPRFTLFPASSDWTPYRSRFHRPIPLFSSPAINESTGVTSSGGLIPTTEKLWQPGLEVSCPLPASSWPWAGTGTGTSPTAGKWQSMNLVLLNSCVTTVTRVGYDPVYSLNWSRENSTFWYESVACVSAMTCNGFIRGNKEK